jgi:hypothetical protein
MSAAPPSQAPAGVPSGNGKYIAVAVLLLLGMGGIAIWKFTGNDSNPTALAAPSGSLAAGSLSAPVNPKLDDVPPPPPPAPDAAPPVASTKQQGGGTGVAVGACDAKCTGTASSDLDRALQQRAAAARRCYNSALANDSSLKGRVVLDVKIATNGSVCAVGVSQTDMPTVAPCVANVFRGASFTPPSGGCVERAVPMNFTSAGGM